VSAQTLVSSKRLEVEQCHHLPPAARTFAAAASTASQALLAAAPSIVFRASSVSKERLDVVKLLSERLVLAQLTSCDNFGLNVAATAVAFGSVDCVSYLLMDRCLPHNQSIKLLLPHSDDYISQDLEAPSRYVTMSLLHIAALRGDAAIIRLLCRINPSSVNALSSEGMTALHYAIAARSALSSIDALLAHGANPVMECGSQRGVGGTAGGTNAFVLATCMYSDVLELLTMHAPVSRKNVSVAADDSSDDDANSDSTETQPDAKSNVFSAVAAGNLTVVAKELKRGLDVESRNSSGRTLLMVACACGQRSIAKRILKHGADMDATDLNGKTAAHLALQHGKQEVCEFLLSCGASKDLPDASGVTVEFLIANPESLVSYIQHSQNGTDFYRLRDGSKMTRQSACIALQRFALDVAQSRRARCYMQHHGSCAASGRDMLPKPWPKRSSYIKDRHRRMRATIVMLQCNIRCHQARWGVISAYFLSLLLFILQLIFRILYVHVLETLLLTKQFIFI
jgi:ankyrin repeat protein